MNIRIYGASLDHGSFARVAAGMRHGLSEHGHLAGFVPIDAIDEDTAYPGHDADVGVFAGPPDRVGLMTSMGWHKERLAMLAANSTWLPKGLITSMERHVTGWLAPSAWAADVLRGYTKLPVSVWRHGVDAAFVPDAVDRQAAIDDYDHGYFRVGHLASTTMQRKGTRELVRAWCRAVKDGAFLGATHPMLTLVVDGPHDAFVRDVLELADGDRRVVETVQWSRRTWNMDPVQAAHWYRKHHVIAQPSRGEGFGMVPLEALACAVPVLMTGCTGHQEYAPMARADGGGAVYVATGALAPIDDGPGAMAPMLHEDDVYAALGHAYSTWPRRFAAALAANDDLRARWNWAEVTRLWLRERS